jgi:transposase
LGNPLRVILSAGQIADIEQAAPLIKDQPATYIVADRGYDSDAFVETITAQGGQAVIPPRSNRLNPRTFDRHLYRDRNLIERFFARIKHFRRIATRYDKLAKSFLSFVHLACAIVWLA